MAQQILKAPMLEARMNGMLIGPDSQRSMLLLYHYFIIV